MRRAPLLAIGFGLLLACGGRQHTTPSGARTVAPEPQQPQTALPNGFDRLIDAAQLLAASPVTQDAVVEALQAVAAVLREQDARAAAEIHGLADELAAGGAPIAIVQEALRRASRVLESRISIAPPSAVRDAYIRSVRAVAALNQDESLSSQEEQVQTAFSALANLVAAVHGRPSVPELANTIEVGYDAAAFRERIDRASELVSELATARDWKSAAEASHRALRALAEVVEVAPMRASRAEWRTLVLTIRFSALRLRGMELIGQERSDHVRAGLLSSLAAIKRMTQDTRIIATARTAAESVDPNSLFVFQRAAIQDAFRTHVQAFDLIARQERSERHSAGR